MTNAGAMEGLDLANVENSLRKAAELNQQKTSG